MCKMEEAHQLIFLTNEEGLLLFALASEGPYHFKLFNLLVMLNKSKNSKKKYTDIILEAAVTALQFINMHMMLRLCVSESLLLDLCASVFGYLHFA